MLHQRLEDAARWREVSTGRVGEDGQFELRHLLRSEGELSYRVVKPSATGLVRSVSNVVPVTVWHTHGDEGSMEIVFVDVRDAFRVRFDLQGSASPPGRPAILSPYAHCRA